MDMTGISFISAALDTLGKKSPIALKELLQRTAWRRGYGEPLLAMQEAGLITIAWNGKQFNSDEDTITLVELTIGERYQATRKLLEKRKGK